ncbi:FAD-binding oxidoreductase [Roseobacter sp. YSTF-M11]|uniref:FAD-binding oxidoreductase n=1 Tax=Roseobacter insulae TaxID=2859783 RepID=A0A9X1FX88_9RHOB|nr:FAD-binding oxidoreductase [Roseobacter insulae]MBW4709241.1 FAD-binding oxidoreductase [Roseobacter insulae]
MTQKIIVIGAGIVGVSTGIWLRRFGADVTLIDRAAPGQGTSYGNAGVLAACSMVPVTAPGLVRKGPGMLMNRDFPLFLKWGYLPRLAPWLMRYLRHANDADTRRIAKGLTPIVGDAVDQHKALTKGTDAAHWVTDSDYHFAYADRGAFEADSYSWSLRRDAGFAPEVHIGAAVQEVEPNLSPAIGCLATMKDHGFIRDPGSYVAALADIFQKGGGVIRTGEVVDFDLSQGRVNAVITTEGALRCDAAILATGVWSKPLMKKLGISVPQESERGYHIVFEGAEKGPRAPTMVASGKFVATPMAAGMRCAGVVEFGGLEAGPSRAPLELLRRKVSEAYPGLIYSGQQEWLGHRPAPADSLPLIGEVARTGVLTAFGHHHIGLTGGPKTGRLVAEMLTGRASNLDLDIYSPNRFATG